MVNLSQILMLPRHYKNMTPDSYWKKRQIFKMAAHFYGRRRNCWSIAIRAVHKALQFVVRGREVRKQYSRFIWSNRISSGLDELGHMPKAREEFMECLNRSYIYLSRQSLSNLAIWEPRTFKAISKIAAVKAKQDEVHTEKLGPPPKGIYTRGKL